MWIVLDCVIPCESHIKLCVTPCQSQIVCYSMQIMLDCVTPCQSHILQLLCLNIRTAWTTLILSVNANSKVMSEQEFWSLKSAPAPQWWGVQQVLQTRSGIIFIMCEEGRTREGTQGRLSRQSKWWKWDQFMTSCFALIGDVWRDQEMK